MKYIGIWVKYLLIASAFATALGIIFIPVSVWSTLVYMGNDKMRYVLTWVSVLSWITFIVVPSYATVIEYISNGSIYKRFVEENNLLIKENKILIQNKKINDLKLIQLQEKLDENEHESSSYTSLFGENEHLFKVSGVTRKLELNTNDCESSKHTSLFEENDQPEKIS